MEKNIGAIDCKSAGELMFDYLDGELSKTEEWSLEAHISGCEDCKKKLEERKNILDTVKLSAENPPNELKIGVMKKIENVPQEKAGWSIRPSAKLTSALAVAACAVIMIAVGFRGFLFPDIAMGDAPAGNGDVFVQAEVASGVKAVAVRSFDTYAQIPNTQVYSDTPANVVEIKTQGSVIADGDKPASADDSTAVDKVFDYAVDAVGENMGVVVGYAEPFEEIIADAAREETEFGGVMYTCYTVTENCYDLVRQLQSGELASEKPWRAHLPSDTEITAVRVIILDKQ